MEIYSVGTDIIEVHRVKRAINDYRLFRSRVYTSEEIAYCEGKGIVKYQSYAARFAAKEAVAKSLGTGFGKKLSLKEIEIFIKSGRPLVHIAGKGSTLMGSLGISRVEVSISSTRQYAVAFAVSLI